MELTQVQISEILLNYTSSSEVFVTLQSLIRRFLILNEHELFTDYLNVSCFFIYMFAQKL